MKKLYQLVLFLLLADIAAAQNNINFQGKIYSGGNPVNYPNATFIFSIPDINWGDTLYNVPVINGLYAVTLGLPQSVFDSANSSRQMVVKYNGNRIDTVTLYAPVERDPTVRSYIRDSVLWGNIRNKPTVDTSLTNEIQIISRHGDTLFLSNGGGYALLPHVSDTLHSTTVNGIFTVIDTAATTLVSLPFLGTPTSPITGAYWQSFKATGNGKLRLLYISVGSTTVTPPVTCGGIKITIYSGPNTGGSFLASKTFNGPISCSTAATAFDLSSGLSGLPFVTFSNGSFYTFKIEPTTGYSLTVLADASNPYPNGTSSIGNTTDIPFNLTVDNSDPACLTFDNNCRVGIGTNMPTAQLEVKGRIKDQTGFVAPPGSIMAYGGRNVPQGWLLCDGRTMSRTAYSDLFDAIDTSWGAGNSIATFNLPDLRGQFLRGVDTSINVGSNQSDPDHASRLPSNAGGNSGNQVGSKQDHAFSSHFHGVYGPGVNVNAGSTNSGQFAVGPTTGYSSNSTGGNETRPKNVYVYYIIKY